MSQQDTDRNRKRVELFARHLERHGMKPREAREKSEDIARKCENGLLTKRERPKDNGG